MAIADRTLAGRAVANLARGIGGSLPLALLPPLLARQLPAAEFAVWVLVVQFAGYVAYLELGIQTAVSKTVASAFAVGGLRAARGPADAGVRLLGMAAVVGASVVGLGVLMLPTVFDIPAGLVDEARTAFLVLGIAASIALPASAAQGALLGIGRNDLSAFAVVMSRLPSVALVAVGAGLGWSVPELALVLALGTVANGVLSFGASRFVGVRIGLGGGSRPQRREILGLTATFGIFTVATLLITGIDIVVVGVVDFDEVAAYGLGASLVAVIAAGYTLIAMVLLPAFADASSRGEVEMGRQLMTRSTRLGSWVLVLGVTFSFAIEPAVSSVWAGPYAEDSGVVFMILLAATSLRLLVSPLAQYLIGIGDHRAIRLPAVGEASLNVVLSVALGLWVGARGVAVATLIAASVTFVYYLARLAPRALKHQARTELVRNAFVSPLAVASVALPLILIRWTWLSASVLIVVAWLAARELRKVGRSFTPELVDRPS